MSDYVFVEDKDGNVVQLAGDVIDSIFYPRSKVVWGANDAVNDASAASPLPVGDAAAVTSIGTLADAESASGNGSVIALLKRVRTLLSDDGGYYVNGTKLTVKRAFANIAQNQSAAQLIAAVSNKALRVLAAVIVTGGTATDIAFKSASTVISPVFSDDAHGGLVLPKNDLGWFETNTSEALNVQTGAAGSSTGILVVYVEIS